MDWVTEKEEWLVDWNDATKLKDINFDHLGDAGGRYGTSPNEIGDAGQDAFFVGPIEAGGRCFVCRACATTVDIFDVSPTGESFVFLRVRLPSPVVRDIGISHVCNMHEAFVTLLFFTQAHLVHQVQIVVGSPALEIFAGSSTICTLPSTPSAFCALAADFVVFGCSDGTLRSVRLHHSDFAGSRLVHGVSQMQGGYDFSDMSLLQKICCTGRASPLVLALAAAGMGVDSGFRLLSFSADGQLRLWSAHERRGHLVASCAVQSLDQIMALVGTSSASIQVNPSKTHACLVIRNSVFLVDLPTPGAAERFALSPIDPPFIGATPSLVTLSDSSIWSIWSGHSREQLFHTNLDQSDTPFWQQRALDACNVDIGAASRVPALRSMVTQGCGQASPHRAVFALCQQHEVWKAEEDGFNVLQFMESLEIQRRLNPDAQRAELVDVGSSYNESFDRGSGIEELALAWWVGRVFLPGRYSSSVILAAMEEAGVPFKDVACGITEGAGGTSAFRNALEEHLRKQFVAHGGRVRDAGGYPLPLQGPTGSSLQAAVAIAAGATDFLRVCDSTWRRKHRICGIAVSGAWAPHAWYPAGDIPASSGATVPEQASVACPLMFSQAGVSCVRAVHSWPERWWATLHLTRDLSNYEKVEIENVLQLSELEEWKFCATAWFLSQCVGSCNLGMALAMLHRGSLPSAALRRFVEDVPKHLAGHLSRCLDGLRLPAVAPKLEHVREAVVASTSPASRPVRVMDRTLDTLNGAWTERVSAGVTGGAAAVPTPESAALAIKAAPQCFLTDVLRGSIATSECEYACAAMRDLLLLCVYAATPVLRVRVHSGHHLMGSDAYVALKVGEQQKRTPTVHNSLDPVWSIDNEFVFVLEEQAHARLDIQVTSESTFGGSLGTASVDFGALSSGQWHRVREQLVGGREGEVEIEVCLDIAHAAATQQPPAAADWGAMLQVVDDQLPRYLALLQSMRLQVPSAIFSGLAAGPSSHVATRCCDLWASAYRAQVDGGRQIACIRPPLASFRGFPYALHLLRGECWDALRWWSRHEPMRELAAYLAACEWLATRRDEAAREAFIAAEGCARTLMQCLRQSGSGPSRMSHGPPSIQYCVHVASLYLARGRTDGEFFFSKRAATMAEADSASVGRPLHQRLWSSVFEKAVQLELWEEACDALLRVDSFESHLRLLGQRLRSSGKIELIMNLPDKHRTFFLSSLHEHASMSPPVAGSDSLACYNLLYALHFSSQEYSKAGVVAYMLYQASDEALKHLMPTGVGTKNALGKSFASFCTGDCVSLPADVPRPHFAGGDDDAMACDSIRPFGALAKAFDHVWPLLEQQRSAVLMCISAITLTPQKLLVVPRPHADSTATASSGVRAANAAPDLDELRSWFSESAAVAKDSVFTLEDAEKILATIEAQMVLSGKSDLSTPSDLAHCVAALGLLGLALQICTYHGLDPWLFALQPFTKLCLASEEESDDKVTALVDAARGPAQAHMFVRSDGCEPLGTGGSVRRGLWRTLQESLSQLARTDSKQDAIAHEALSATAVRWYSLVADEVLTKASSNDGECRLLPKFITDALSAGPSWVCLLRLYMKHCLPKDAVDLLTRQLKQCAAPPSPARSTRGGIWSPLDDFPVTLVMQLHAWLSGLSKEERNGGERTRCLETLDAVLEKFRGLFSEAKN